MAEPPTQQGTSNKRIDTSSNEPEQRRGLTPLFFWLAKGRETPQHRNILPHIESVIYCAFKCGALGCGEISPQNGAGVPANCAPCVVGARCLRGRVGASPQRGDGRGGNPPKENDDNHHYRFSIMMIDYRHLTLGGCGFWFWLCVVSQSQKRGGGDTGGLAPPRGWWSGLWMVYKSGLIFRGICQKWGHLE